MVRFLSMIVVLSEFTASQVATVSAVKLDSKVKNLAIGKDDSSIQVCDKSSRDLWLLACQPEILSSIFRH